MDSSRLFGRTSFGTQEILQKSGRLTQSERLVLIVLGDQTAVPALLGKLSALTPERIEQALVRLIELNLAYEIVAPTPDAAVTATIPVNALRTFLAQAESDPVTVMASAEQKEATAHARALNASVGQVIDSAVARAEARTAPVAVPLSKLFPEYVAQDQANGFDTSSRGSTQVVGSASGRWEPGGPLDSGGIITGTDLRGPTGMRGASSTERRWVPDGDGSSSDAATGGNWALVVGGVVAVAIFGALLIYMLK